MNAIGHILLGLFQEPPTSEANHQLPWVNQSNGLQFQENVFDPNSTPNFVDVLAWWMIFKVNVECRVQLYILLSTVAPHGLQIDFDHRGSYEMPQTAKKAK